MLSTHDIEMQAHQFLQGAARKGITFDAWAASKDFAPEDREHILDYIEILGAPGAYHPLENAGKVPA